ncbi:MAG: 3-phosphoshikimate 1-carboxyvinyltransferase [Pseudomonadota bacterium]
MSTAPPNAASAARPAAPPRGEIRPPGDKSISHRAHMLGAIAEGETRVDGLLDGEDVMATAAALRAMGATIDRDGPQSWRIVGPAGGRLSAPTTPLDLGNAGTGVRLLMGLVAGRGLRATFDGDASLRKRPMRRILDPLRQMGVEASARGDDLLPVTLSGSTPLKAISYDSPVASAQVKSAILLAGLGADGVTEVREPAPSRDHTERMLGGFGVAVEKPDPTLTRIAGGQRLKGCALRAPADPSSAAFAAALAAATPGAEVRLKDVGTNPLRTGFFAALRAMGARIAYDNEREIGGEPIADIVVEGGPLRGIDLPADRAPAMIDEYPILAVCAATATGASRFRGLHELRVKESDRLAGVAAGLVANGVAATVDGDDLIVVGCGGPPPGGGRVAAALDHRIAMSFLVLGLLSQTATAVDDVGPVATSYPSFFDDMAALGAPVDISGNGAA